MDSNSASHTTASLQWFYKLFGGHTMSTIIEGIKDLNGLLVAIASTVSGTLSNCNYS